MNPKAIQKVIEAMSWSEAWVVIEVSPNGPKHVIAVCVTALTAGAVVKEFESKGSACKYKVEQVDAK